MDTNSLSDWWHSTVAVTARRAGARATRRLLPVVVGCLAATAGADPRPGNTSPTSGDLYSSKSEFHCAPSPVGNGTWPKLRSNAAGSVAWWYCPGASGGWSLSFAAATATNLSAAKVWDDIYKVITASDLIAAFHALVAERVTAPMDDPRLKPVWLPYLPEMRAGVPLPAARASIAMTSS